MDPPDCVFSSFEQECRESSPSGIGLKDPGLKAALLPSLPKTEASRTHLLASLPSSVQASHLVCTNDQGPGATEPFRPSPGFRGEPGTEGRWPRSLIPPQPQPFPDLASGDRVARCAEGQCPDRQSGRSQERWREGAVAGGVAESQNPQTAVNGQCR